MTILILHSERKLSIVSVMIRPLFTILGVTLILGALPAPAQRAEAKLVRHLDAVYQHWRAAMLTKNHTKWKTITATHRQISITNRIHSERRPVASTLFSLPAIPPDTRKLKLLDAKVKGITANLSFFGPVDFGVEGVKPPDNLLTLSFVREGAGWRYDTADYVNLAVLPEVRQQLAAGQLAHFKQPEFTPKGSVVQPMVTLRGPVKYIAKTYVYCPGREVKMSVNKVSRHLYQNTKESEIVIGGARDGRNEVQFAITSLPGSAGTEPLAIRVYLLSQIQGTKPIKIFQYQVAEKNKVKPFGTEHFLVTPAIGKQILGR
jgi:hypothetical protein